MRLYTSNRILRCENDEKDGKIVWNDNNAPKLLPSSWIEFLSLSWIKEAVPKLAAQSNEKRENHHHRWWGINPKWLGMTEAEPIITISFNCYEKDAMNKIFFLFVTEKQIFWYESTSFQLWHKLWKRSKLRRKISFWQISFPKRVKNDQFQDLLNFGAKFSSPARLGPKIMQKCSRNSYTYTYVYNKW